MGIKFILAVGIAVLFAAGAFWSSQIAPSAQQGQGDDGEIKKLITELGDEQFVVRDRATTRLTHRCRIKLEINSNVSR